MAQIPLAIGLRPEPTFASFVLGDNALALAQLTEWQGAPSSLYLWGPPGCGKTHLLRALAADERWGDAPIVWFDARHPLPWSFGDSAALIVLDDCHAYDVARQHAAFVLFVAAATHGVPIAAAGGLPPVDLPLRDDLRTRLGCGHVIALQPLHDDELRLALHHAASRRGFALPDDVIDHLLSRFSRDMKHLAALLDRLDVYALAHRRALTVPLLRQMLAEPSSPPPSDVPADAVAG